MAKNKYSLKTAHLVAEKKSVQKEDWIVYDSVKQAEEKKLKKDALDLKEA